MAASWSLGGVPLYVVKDSGDEPRPRVDYINPITSTQTTYIRQHGKDSPKRELQAFAIENYPDVFALVDGTAKALVSPWGNEGTYVVMDTKSDRVQDFSQCESRLTVRLTLDLVKVT